MKLPGLSLTIMPLLLGAAHAGQPLLLSNPELDRVTAGSVISVQIPLSTFRPLAHQSETTSFKPFANTAQSFSFAPAANQSQISTFGNRAQSQTTTFIP
jgi:hypothetical protein